MKTTRYLFLVLAFPLLFLGGCANHYFKQGDKEFNQLSFSKASKDYSKGLDKRDKLEARIRLADCYRLMNDVDRAEIEYAKVIDTPGIDPVNYFHYGKILMEKEKYHEAKRYFILYLASRPDDVVAQMLLRSCNSISSFYVDTSLWSLKKVNMPNVYSAFASVPLGSGVVFTGDKEVKLEREKSPWTGRSYMDLYFSQKDKDGNWIAPQILKGDINGQYHEGPATFSADGKTVYFTRSNYLKKEIKKSKTNQNNLKIFRAELVDGKWTNITDLPFNSDEYSVGHPCLSPEGNALFFISDMPGGYGGTDIYSVIINPNNTYSKPKNMGPVVNTPGNEMFPYYDSDGSLYFSSDAHNTMGGLDVFVTSWDGSRWLQPENLNAPLNSSKDDFAYVPDPNDKTKGMVSSNRSNKDQLYEFKHNPPTFNLIVTVREKANHQPIRDGVIELMDWSSRKKVSFTTDAEGKIKTKISPETDLSVMASKDGFFSQSSEVSTRDKKVSETLYAEFDLVAMVIEKPIVLENIYYDLDKWAIRPDAAKELDKLVKVLNDNPNISIEMGSHTDSRAGDYYNLVLSDKRAKAAVQYLIARGIDAGRLKWKGYGETRLVNRCKNGVKCSEEEHQQNRRTEFKVIKIAQPVPKTE